MVPLDLRQVGACEGQQVVVEIGADDFDSSMMQFDCDPPHATAGVQHAGWVVALDEVGFAVAGLPGGLHANEAGVVLLEVDGRAPVSPARADMI